MNTSDRLADVISDATCQRRNYTSMVEPMVRSAVRVYGLDAVEMVVHNSAALTPVNLRAAQAFNAAQRGWPNTTD